MKNGELKIGGSAERENERTRSFAFSLRASSVSFGLAFFALAAPQLTKRLEKAWRGE